MAQNAQGEAPGHVTDLGVDFMADPNVRGYQTGLRRPFHNDNADVVGLPCLQTARSGGLSRVVGSTAIYNAVLHSRTPYEDWPEPERRRYLLRLWLNAGLVGERPASWADRCADWFKWQLDPRPPAFDLSKRRAERAH